MTLLAIKVQHFLSIRVWENPGRQQLSNKCKNIIDINLSYSARNSPSMQEVPNLKYKTILCHNWVENSPCLKGLDCYFAHGYEEMRTIEQNREALASRSQPALNYKTVFCRFYTKGQCQLNDACTFAHERREKKVHRLSPPLPQQPNISFEQYYQWMAYYSQLASWNQQYANYPPEEEDKLKDSWETNDDDCQTMTRRAADLLPQVEAVEEEAPSEGIDLQAEK